MKKGILLSYLLLFIGTAIVSFSAGSNITGNFVLGSAGNTIVSFVGLALIGSAIGLFVMEGGLEQRVEVDPTTKSMRRKAEKEFKKAGIKNPKIEKGEKYFENVGEAWDKYKQLINGGKKDYKKEKDNFERYGPEVEIKHGPRLYISEEAIERADDDKTIKRNLKDYVEEISKIVKYAKEGHKKYFERMGRKKEFRISPHKSPKDPRIVWDYDDKEDALRIFDVLYHINEKDYTDYWNRRAERGEIGKQDYTFEKRPNPERLSSKLAA